MRKFNLIVAVCENNGIGINGDLPWRLKSELKYFSRMTKTVKDPLKKNAVIMGRKTYFGIPEGKRPLPERVNIVLSRTSKPEDYPCDVILCDSLENAMKLIHEDDKLNEIIENIWIVGGSSVYKEALESKHCNRLYLTDIKAKFDCDTFFPKLTNDFQLIDNENDNDVPQGIQEENGIKYEYKIYGKCS